MSLNFEKKSFELFEKLSAEEKYKVMLAEGEPVIAQTLRSLLTEEEDQNFVKMFEAYKQVVSDMKEIFMLVLIGKNLMREILCLQIKLIEKPCETDLDPLLEIVSQINQKGEELIQASEELITFYKEIEILSPQAKILMDVIGQPIFPEGILALTDKEFIEKFVRGFAEIKKPIDFIYSARALEAKEIIEGNDLRERVTKEARKLLEII